MHPTDPTGSGAAPDNPVPDNPASDNPAPLLAAPATGQFDIAGPLPQGTVLLEASAGTGKTWTIAALVTRYVCEGQATLDEMLVVTFGRTASQELRERVRAQLVEAERALTAQLTLDVEDRTGRAALALRTDGSPDQLLTLVLDCDDTEALARQSRLRAALSSFDSATIATIHQFSHQVLRSLGIAGDSDPSAVLVEDLDDLVVEVTDDLYLQEWAEHPQPPLTRSQALQLARDAVIDRQALLVPEPLPEPGEELWEIRVRFAHRVRTELHRRKQHLGLLGYDDLLSELARALGEHDSPARRRMRERWRVVLVDEFQDTDPVQWQIFHRAFGGHRTMVLIGDAKQAIYAFRGGDVFTYLAAAETADSRQTLATNFRSDRDLVDRVNALLGGAALGHPDIVVGPVQAHRAGSRLTGAGDPFRLRVVERDHLAVRGRVGVADFRAHIFSDLARDVKRLLTSGAQFDGRPLEPHDVAVLAQTNAQLQAARDALQAVGVPAVVAGNESVFRTQAAGEWLVLLEALEQPHRADRVRSAGLSAFLGRSATELDQGGEQVTEQLAETIREWSDLLNQRGVSAVMEAATTHGLMSRLLRQVGGERLLTDLRHIGQVLHQTERDHHLGTTALANWLRVQASEDTLDVGSERTRRLDSDAAAVQLLTVHRSKGLEFPVVYLPSVWDRFPRDPAVPLFHAAAPAVDFVPDSDPGSVPGSGPAAGTAADPGPGLAARRERSEVNLRRRNVGGLHSPQWWDDVKAHLHEDAGESLRLLYVALTRAQSQVVAWHATTPKNTHTSPLHRMLFGRRPGAAEVPDEAILYDPDRVPLILSTWAQAGGPQWEEASAQADVSEPLPLDTRRLAVRAFTRAVDPTWRRTSYSALTSVVDHLPALSEPEEPPLSDEPDAEEVSVNDAGPVVPVGTEVPSPMADLPVGATFGSLVHAVLEHADPAAPAFGGDFAAELRHHVTEQLVWWPVPVDPEALVQALVQVCASPLGPLADNLTLMDLGLPDRLRELDFELPLAGGDQPHEASARVTLGDLAPLLRAHLPEGDPVRGYVDQLHDPVLADQRLLGYLTGSIDVVLRVGSGDAQRFLTVDYKTNWLGGLGSENGLTAEQYRPEALAAAMAHSDYPLQALLYTVVLHRYLRWRLAGYDPERHLGGVLYLYLRGMCGPETPTVDGAPCGVFSWRPPVALVHALSDLLDGQPS